MTLKINYDGRSDRVPWMESSSTNAHHAFAENDARGDTSAQKKKVSRATTKEIIAVLDALLPPTSTSSESKRDCRLGSRSCGARSLGGTGRSLIAILQDAAALVKLKKGQMGLQKHTQTKMSQRRASAHTRGVHFPGLPHAFLVLFVFIPSFFCSLGVAIRPCPTNTHHPYLPLSLSPSTVLVSTKAALAGPLCKQKKNDGAAVHFEMEPPPIPRPTEVAGIIKGGMMASFSVLTVEVSFPACQITSVGSGFVSLIQERCVSVHIALCSSVSNYSVLLWLCLSSC